MPERGPIQTVLGAAATLAAALLLTAELTPLFTLHVASGRVALPSVTGGSHDSYALVPVALLTLALAVGVWQAGSRLALLAVGVLGALALLLGLLRDLPDARGSGLLQDQPGHLVQAASRPSAGLYLETAGAALLIITAVSGLILLGPAPARLRSPAPELRDER